MDRNSLCASLLKWVQTFPGRGNVTVSSLTEGVVMAGILNQIAPEFFTHQWMVKLKGNVGDNWRLKVSNLRKVLQGIMDYCQEALGLNIKDFPLPDLNKIGERSDEGELARMLQLILVCAINCEQKQLYIQNIMQMEESVQAVIMSAIQELMARERSPGAESATFDLAGRGLMGDLGPASFHPQLKTVLEQLEATTKTKEDLVQRCLELDLQVSTLVEEKNSLTQEKATLTERLEALEVRENMGGTLRYMDLKKQIDGLRDEIFKLETVRDEYKARVEALDRENQEVVTKNEELQQLADEARSLKDEVDALRDMSERVALYEGTVETYKKKLEELSDLKRQVKILEEKNSDYVQHNMELEEELKKSGTWKHQLELYKKQVSDLHQKLSEETKNTDRCMFDNKKLNEKMEALIQEKDRLVVERDALKENVDELRCQISALTSPDTSSRPPSDLSDAEMLEIIPHEIREKLVRLQHENRILKQRASESGSGDEVLQAMLNDLQERHNSMTQENRRLNQRIMELESEVDELKSGDESLGALAAAGSSSRGNTDVKNIQELENKVAEQKNQILTLEESLVKKESDMAVMEERYKKYLGKAKSVIRTLDPKLNPPMVPDVSALRLQLQEKERTIENMEHDAEKAKMIRDVEDKLVTSCFYNLGMQLHRQMINQRLSAIDSGQTFLARQRQATSRRVPLNQGNRQPPSMNQLADMQIS